MFSQFLSFFNRGMRAYKIQDANRQRRLGITAKSLEDIISKGCEKLKIEESDVTVVLEDDGTIVDNNVFFKTLPSHTVLVFLKKNESWKGAGTLIYDALSKLHNSSMRADIVDQIKDLLEDENSPEKIHLMSQYLDLLKMDIEAEEKYEDEDWFEGLNQKYKSKSEVLKHTAQTRIRSYYTAAKDQIEKESKGEEKELLMELIDDLSKQLKDNDFHGHYFDRRAPAKKRICDKNGWFTCEGAFDQDKCELFHTINPYASRGHRQLFGLWNLDHMQPPGKPNLRSSQINSSDWCDYNQIAHLHHYVQIYIIRAIEKSREIIPSLLEAVKSKRKSTNIEGKYVYRLLFTRDNLKLVQIACHKKAARVTKKCNPDDFLIKS